MAMASTKLVCIKQKSPTLPTAYPAWNAGFRQSRGFFMPPKRQSLKSRAEPPTGNTALYKGRSLSNIHPNALLREAGWICWYYFTTHPAFCQYFSAGSLSPSGCNASVLQCLAAESAQRTAVRLSYGLPSQAVRF